MSHRAPIRFRVGRRTATGPGLRDLLRSPSGLGGRPGGSHSAHDDRPLIDRARVSADSGRQQDQHDRSSEDLGGRGRCSGNRCCELLGTGWRNLVPGRCGRAADGGVSVRAFRDLRRVGITLARGRPALRRRLRRAAMPSPTRSTSIMRRRCWSGASGPPSPRSRRRATARRARWPGSARASSRASSPFPRSTSSAPVEEGTDDQELNVAVGHDPQSVWPGVDGAAVFLAHDVSYFVHLNQLKPGDVITYQTACNTVKFQVSGAAGRPRRLAGVEHHRAEPGARHVLAAQRALLHPGPPADPGHRGRRRHQGRQPRSGRAVRADGRSPPTTRPRPRRRCRRRG